jgi:hypothetical protein
MIQPLDVGLGLPQADLISAIPMATTRFGESTVGWGRFPERITTALGRLCRLLPQSKFSYHEAEISQKLLLGRMSRK